MNASRPALIALGALLIAGLVGASVYWQRRMTNGLPPRASFATQGAAYTAALTAANEDTTRVVAVLGTGSMQPYLPAAPAGADPMKTVVAYAVKRANARFSDIQSGDLCLYQPSWQVSHDTSCMHQAASRDSGGWIMTGSHNPTYENTTRVTEANFIGIVQEVCVWN